MPHDSEHRAVGLSTPDEATQQESAASYRCSHCVLIFKTRFYLYEHLHQVHGLGIEAALRDSGLKTLPKNKPKPENRIKTLKSDFAFNCKNCTFKSCNWSVFSEHKNQCTVSSNNESPIPKASIFFKPQKPPSSSIESNSVKASRKSTSKDVKIYSKSPQTITKYFTAASTVKSHHQTKEKDTKTLRLEDSSLKSCGVFQVKATSIDMGSMSTAHLLSDLILDPTSAKPVDPFKEATLNNASKRTSKESVESDPSKKAKLETNQPNHTQTSNCAELSFEVSDDEEGKDLVSEEADAIKSYFCKHCDFKSASMEHVYSHYEESHPYLRYNSFYIEEKSDQSATFRCLECPVEFPSDTHLRNHYKDHPGAPDIFNMKSADLNLVYKCFVCPFTSSILHSLREHHKEKHPSLKVENPLLYDKYSSTQHSINDTKSRSSGEQDSLKTIHSERSTTPCQDERSPSLSPKPQPKAQDGTLYYCGQCTFSHKSVVVLHVHYKKCHPQEPITLDKIKQSAGASSVTASAQNPDMNVDLSNSSVKEETWASPLADPETISESISVERKLQPAPLTAELDCPTSSSLNKMFLCDSCNFSNSKIKSVISHHNAKHGSTTTIEDILKHTAAMENKVVASEVSNSVPSVYPCAQELYYCQLCNYGNPTLKGVLGHQNKIHENCKSKESVLEYTAKIRDQIEKSKSHPTNSILPSGLPLPLIKGKSPLFFCYLCNYRHKKISLINSHFFKVHKGCRVNAPQILEHTSVIYERLQENSKNLDTFLEHVKKNLKVKKLQTSTYVPPSQVRLKCFKCSYVSQHVYLMRKHLIAGHKVNMTFSNVVQLCGTGAQFEPGYYCDMCSFRCDDVAEVKTHSIERHCGRSLSIQFMSTRLYLSPDICDPKKRSTFFNDDDLPDGNLPKTYPEAYSCKACSFKGTSFSSITSHYQAVHPWTVKDGGSMLDVDNSSKKQILSNKKPDPQQDVDTYQAPLDLGNANASTAQAKAYRCSYCQATFRGHGGLIIHMGMKHRDRIEETPSLAKRMQVFKCRSCSYVNNIRSGVLTHTKMKHPNKALKSGSFYVEIEHLHNVEMKVKNGNWKFCGYGCKECSQIFSSKEKLNEHRKTHKKQPMLNLITPAPDGSKQIHKEIWCQFCGLFCATAKDHSEHLRVCPKNSSTYSCALCPDTFSTKVQLGIHYSKKHGEEAFFKHYAPLYNQPSDKTTDQQQERSIQSTLSQTELLRMFKCPSCRYVNASYHGTLTHCQMRHPKVVVRAETLKTIEIDIANMIGYLPNSKKYGGFRCKKCPLIYGTLKKLKRHCETDHNTKAQASSQPLAHTPQLSVDQNIGSESASSSQTKCVSKFRHYFKCSLCSYSTSLLKSLGRHYRNRHGKAAYKNFYSPLFNQFNKTPKSQVKYEQAGKNEAEVKQEKATPQVRVYKCSICSYGTPYRRYLIAHFRNRHKLETKAISKQMEKFKNWEPTLPIGRFNCKKCLNVFYPSKMRLLAHYGKVHRSEVVDFTIVAERTYRTTGVYRCDRCKQKIFGLKNIWKHLDQHRAKLMKTKHKEMEIKVEVSEENPPPTLYPIEDEMKLKLRSDEIIKSPPALTVPLLNAEVPQQPSEGKHTCLRCKRTFMSLKGLRSHERSHAAFAALDNLTASESEEHIDQYIVYRHGTTRPYMCKLCSYRTTVLGLGKSHFLKKHRYVSNSTRVDKHFEGETQQVKEAAPNIINDFNADGDEEPENSFLEPPDVQRQLKHYNVMAQIDPAAKIQDKIHLSDPRMLPCEMCNFNSHHYANMRRHYLRRHGKKLIRCKDCSFFTCYKQNLDLHEQMGHLCVQSEPTHQKNLCCPFCLYQSKNKNNMIDHIVLHREERMVPMEVRRSKLSRCLQGIVFRCYKCTFTSGSADSLDSHMAKHNDLKPFKCRLCYFDCTQLRDLEEHLCDKHQVVRNHQLVGQVSLDQLEEKDDRNSLDEDDEYDEIVHYQNDEQALKKVQPNEELTEVAEEPIKEKESNEHILKDGVSVDIPNTQIISRQNADERLKDHTENNDAHVDENKHDNQAQTKTKEVDESSAVCIKEDIGEVQEKTPSLRAAESQKQICLTEYVDDPMVDAVKSIQDSKSNSEIQKGFTDDTTDIDKNGLISPGFVELQISHDVGEDQQRYGVNSVPNDGHAHNQPYSSEETSPYGEMPILEKYFKEQHFIFAQHCENSEKLCAKIREEGAEVGKNDDRETLNPPILLATDVAATVCSPVAVTVFPCDLCGRNLANTSELQRHMMRHGM